MSPSYVSLVCLPRMSPLLRFVDARCGVRKPGSLSTSTTRGVAIEAVEEQRRVVVLVSSPWLAAAIARARDCRGFHHLAPAATGVAALRTVRWAWGARMPRGDR